MSASTHDIQIELEGLIGLLAQNLYADPDVFLREMIQNAHDSITKRHELAAERGDDAPPGAIRVRADVGAGQVSIADNGAGLTEREIHEYLSTIGRSGTRALKEELRAVDRDRAVALIGQFGIGLLSAFIVADAVEVVTRSAVEGAWRWRSGGGKSYTVEPAERAAVGTTVTLSLKDGHRRYLQGDRLREIVRVYADFIGVPVHVDDDRDSANAVRAPWHRAYPSARARWEEHHVFWERRFTDEASLDVLPIDEAFTYDDPERPGEVRTGRVQGVLGITDRHVPDVNTRGTVDLYVARMFICRGNREVLPPWARFIQGVIECDALTPNAARDNVIRDGVLAALQAQLGRRIIAHLEDLARDEPKKLVEIMRWHSYHVLAMCVQDEHEAFFTAVADLVALDSDSGPLTVPQYLEKAPAGRDGPRTVYYLAERGAANQFFLLAQAQGIRVFNAGEPFAERFLKRYAAQWPARVRLAQFDVSGSDAIFRELGEGERDPFRALEAAYTRIFPDLRCVARATEFAPHEVPAVLTETQRGRSRRELEEVAGNAALPRFVRDLVEGVLRDERDPLTLHLNVSNPTVKRLASAVRAEWDAVVENALVSLYNNALLLLAKALTPKAVRTMFGQFGTVTDLMLAAAEQERALRGEVVALRAQVRELKGPSADERTAHVSCFVALPYREAYAEVYAALEAVLESPPYFWDVIRAKDELHKGMLWENIKQHLARAHCFIVDLSEPNPNVLIELGRMDSFDRPKLLLRRVGAPELPADLSGHSYFEYDPASPTLREDLRAVIESHKGLSPLRGRLRHLSHHTLVALGFGDDFARKLAAAYDTCEAFVNAEPAVIAERLGVGGALVRAAQSELRQTMTRHEPR